MATVFTPSAIKRLESLFGVPARSMGTNFRFEIAAHESGSQAVRRLALEIYPDIRIGRKKGNLISVYTEAAHLQMHFCSGFVVSEDLGEATFVGEHRGKLSGLIVERNAGCTLFANVDRAILSGDFTQLAPEVMMSGVALSLTEPVLETEKKAPRRRRTPARRTKAGSRP
ncbi:MAG TPA: hypothetical protein VMF59_15420 [Bacteroidota bacterium]|nr:hypothetical protein [Bacteroidota bacterium]